jgi:hypothetical protein
MLMHNLFFKIVNRLGLLKLKPVVFLHLQKTAGTTIVNLAKHFYGKDNVIGHNGFYLNSNCCRIENDKLFQPEFMQNQIGNIPFISGHFGYGFAKHFMANRYSFTFLRDPIERILSLYFYCKIRDPSQYKHYELAQRLSLDEFLQLGFTDPEFKGRLWNHQVCQLAAGWGDPTFGTHKDDELLDLALQHLDEFSFVGFTETFDKDRDIILKNIGISIPVSKLKSNDNPGRPRFDSLPQSSKDLLFELTALDRQLYELAWARRKSIH